MWCICNYMSKTQHTNEYIGWDTAGLGWKAGWVKRVVMAILYFLTWMLGLTLCTKNSEDR